MFTEPTHYRLVDSPFGAMALVWVELGARPRIVRAYLPVPGSDTMGRARGDYSDVRRGSCEEIDRVASFVDATFRGEAVAFDLGICLLERCAPFQRRVLEREARIPRGRVMTYGGIAGSIGRPGASRAVGTALARNPFPLLVPCHRAIRSDRSPGGYQGGIAMKRALLEMEGVGFDRAGRVVPDFIDCR